MNDMLNKIKKKWDRENEEIKALPRLLIVIASFFLATIISTIFGLITDSLIAVSLFFVLPYFTFKMSFEKLAIKKGK
jgi:hypothetical protein